MKNYKKHISIMLVLMMIFSVASFCVFAEDEMPENAEAVAELQTEEVEQAELTETTATATRVDDTTATLEWGKIAVTEPEAKEAGYYEILIGEEVKDDVTVTSPQETFSTNVSQLEPNAEVTFTIKGYTNDTKAEELGSLTAVLEAENPVVVPGDVTGVDALADYNSVTLKWNAAANAAYYVIVRNDEASCVVYPTGAAVEYYRDIYTEKDKQYSYTVTAVSSTETASTPGYSDAAGWVRTAYNYVTVKKTRKLKCHCCGKKGVSLTVPAGTLIKGEGFSQARYKFKGSNGHTYYINRLSCKSSYCDYNPYVDYTIEEATNFVNHRGTASATGWLIWANYYSQEVYVFTGYAGNWTCVNAFPCCSGKNSTPSPSGDKQIGQKFKKRHGRPYWSCFSSLNAFHDFKGSKERAKAGTPASNGCVRVERANAGYIYANCAKKTRVIAW